MLKLKKQPQKHQITKINKLKNISFKMILRNFVFLSFSGNNFLFGEGPN
jgi:hypothetical protein